jgi:hypothetical protein
MDFRSNKTGVVQLYGQLKRDIGFRRSNTHYLTQKLNPEALGNPHFFYITVEISRQTSK